MLFSICPKSIIDWILGEVWAGSGFQQAQGVSENNTPSS